MPLRKHANTPPGRTLDAYGTRPTTGILWIRRPSWLTRTSNLEQLAKQEALLYEGHCARVRSTKQRDVASRFCSMKNLAELAIFTVARIKSSACLLPRTGPHPKLLLRQQEFLSMLLVPHFLQTCSLSGLLPHFKTVICGWGACHQGNPRRATIRKRNCVSSGCFNTASESNLCRFPPLLHAGASSAKVV